MRRRRATAGILVGALAVTGCGRTNTGEDPWVCGNGVVEAGEQCDDGNTVGGDGCAANCLSMP